MKLQETEREAIRRAVGRGLVKQLLREGKVTGQTAADLLRAIG